MIVRDLLQVAHVEAGILMPDESMSAANGEWARQKLNRMLGVWSNDGRKIFATKSQLFTLGTTQTVYTIGRGTSPAADFVADRPVGSGTGRGIIRANIVKSDSRYAVRLLSATEWASVSRQDQSTAIPFALYNDGASPNSNLYLYGWPNEANQLELFTNQQLSDVDTLDNVIEFPKGYDEAVILSLAEGLCSSYKLTVSPELARSAMQARAAIASTNSTPPRIGTCDAGVPSKTYNGGIPAVGGPLFW